MIGSYSAGRALVSQDTTAAAADTATDGSGIPGMLPLDAISDKLEARVRDLNRRASMLQSHTDVCVEHPSNRIITHFHRG